MSVLPMIITSAGISAAVAADGQGLDLDLVEIALGSGDWSPNSSATALDTEVKRLTTFGATVLAPDTIHVTIRDTSADTYDLREIGLYDASGNLFGVYAQSEPIVSKSAAATVLLTATIKLTTVPPGSVTITGNEFDYPTFSEEVSGVGREATTAEVAAGAAERILTPEKAHAHYYHPGNKPTPAAIGAAAAGHTHPLPTPADIGAAAAGHTHPSPGAVVVSSGSNSNGYYRIWSDGYREQWGSKSTSATTTVSFPIGFNTPSSVIVQVTRIGRNDFVGHVPTVTSSYFSFKQYQSPYPTIGWYAKGY